MFTGIIQHVGSVTAIQQSGVGLRLAIDARNWTYRPALGDSVSVNGCCLTVTRSGTDIGSALDILQFDVIHQTLSMTTLGKLGVGDRVNLEHAVTPMTMLGGHIVQGHVDGIGRIGEMTDREGERRLSIVPPPQLMEAIIEQGSICVDGVSLTVASAANDFFDVALIPTTLQLTTLGDLKVDSSVNLEADYIAKVVVNWLRRSGTKRAPTV
jgi:riboflavin synthase